MPLPDRSEAWPPKKVVPAYRAYRTWDAWYASNLDDLSNVYASAQQAASPVGLWGQVRRWFWGAPNPAQAQQRPNKLHVPVAGELARMSAALLFSEMPTISFPEPDDAATEQTEGAAVPSPQKAYTDRLAEILDDTAHARHIEAGEFSAAHGGSFMRVSWDKSIVPDGPFLTTVAADAAIPEFRWGRLVAVTFWAVLETDDTAGIYTLLERHEPGTVEFGLYVSQKRGELGMRVPLTEHDATAPLAGVVNEGSAVETGSDLLTAVYLPNVLPNRLNRKDPHSANLGRSDFDGIEPLMDELDEAWTSWMRDVRLGKARIVVPKGLITNLGPGSGGTFNSDQEVFVETGEMIGSFNPNTANGKVSSFMEMFQPDIRWQEHAETCKGLLERIYSGAGYSASTFGEAGDTSQTATESTNREKLSSLTRGAKILFARPELRKLYAALMDVDAHVFNGPGRGGLLPDIEFADAAALSPKIIAETLQLLAVSESASIETRVGMLHEDWDPQQIADEVSLIKSETAAPVMGDPAMTPFDTTGVDDAADGPVD